MNLFTAATSALAPVETKAEFRRSRRRISSLCATQAAGTQRQRVADAAFPGSGHAENLPSRPCAKDGRVCTAGGFASSFLFAR